MIPPATWELNEKIHKLEDQLGDARLELARSQARWATALEGLRRYV